MKTVMLPGGLLLDGELHRLAEFHPLTGSIELAIAEAKDSFESYPFLTTNVLSAAVASIGDIKTTPDIIRSLSIPDRQYLMLHLTVLLEGNIRWFKHTCESCRNLFDLSVNWLELPVYEPTGAYPEFEIDINGKTALLRIPDGRIEEKLAKISDNRTAINTLLLNSVLLLDGQIFGQKQLEKLEQDDILKIENALEEHSPAITDQIAGLCPFCQTKAVINLDFSAGLNQSFNILHDINKIALYYHWSENEIAKLPRKRRHQYLKMIDESRGMKT